MKTCTGCKESKTLELFPFDPRGVNGYGSKCKVCRTAISMKRYWAKRDEICRKTREYSKRPEVKERKKVTHALWANRVEAAQRAD